MLPLQSFHIKVVTKVWALFVPCLFDTVERGPAGATAALAWDPLHKAKTFDLCTIGPVDLSGHYACYSCQEGREGQM